MAKRPPRVAPRAATTLVEVEARLGMRAPLANAAEWDNVGIMLGDADWPVTRALLAIDLTDAVAQEALRGGCDLLVVYHPPIFKGVRTISPYADGPTAHLATLAAARVGVIALHTALDAAAGGTNDVLLDAFDTTARGPLAPLVVRERGYKLVTFVPREAVERVRAALAAAGAGTIGAYTHCSFETSGQGTFFGGAGAAPRVGRPGRLETAAEQRLEMVAPAAQLGPVVRALYAAHPYEEPAFDLLPVHEVAGRGAVGMGRWAELARPQRGAALLVRLGRVADLSAAQVVGDARRSFGRVVAAAGAYGVDAFRDRDALYLTGEFKHHDALRLVRRGVTAVALGHWASERPVLPRVREWLLQDVPGVRVSIARRDAAPLRPL